MTYIAVRCPHCHSKQIVKRGTTARGTQRYLCQNALCAQGSFLLDSHNRGCVPEVKDLIIDMRLNASGVHDPARALHISTNGTSIRVISTRMSTSRVSATRSRLSANT